MNASDNRMRLTMLPGDFVIALIILLIAGGMLLSFLVQKDHSPNTVEVWQNGQLKKQLDLSVDTQFQIDGAYQNTIQIQDGKVAILDSTCPGGDCVKSGWRSDAGQSIVCLPNRLELRLTGSHTEQEIDGITG